MLAILNNVKWHKDALLPPKPSPKYSSPCPVWTTNSDPGVIAAASCCYQSQCCLILTCLISQLFHYQCHNFLFKFRGSSLNPDWCSQYTWNLACLLVMGVREICINSLNIWSCLSNFKCAYTYCISNLKRKMSHTWSLCCMLSALGRICTSLVVRVCLESRSLKNK